MREGLGGSMEKRDSEFPSPVKGNRSVLSAGSFRGISAWKGPLLDAFRMQSPTFSSVQALREAGLGCEES